MALSWKSTLTCRSPDSYGGFTRGPNWRPIEQMDSSELEHIFRLNVFASLHLTRAAVPLLPPGGSIIFTASAMAAHPSPDAVEYGASKATLVHIVRSLALQLTPRGLRINGVAPGATYTPFLPSQGAVTEDFTEAVAASLPLGRIAQPVEVSPLWVHLADPYSTYVSGEIFAAVGGSGL
jgi:NAD(P)-dependent dehydrogenase (short-subunit alcohol dehydrogenase family)